MAGIGGLGDLMALVRDFGALKRRMAEIQETLGARTVEGAAGGGMVVATVNGQMELVGLKIDPEVVSRDEVGLLEELVKAAVGQAMAAARDLQRAEMQNLLGGLPIPPGLLDSLLA